MPTALPHLTLTITPPGGSPATYTQYLAYDGANQQNTITQNFGRQGDTATFALMEDYSEHGSPQVVVLAESQVSLYDNVAGENLFSGVVTCPTLVVQVPGLMNEWDLTCTDYTIYADNKVVHGTFYGYTVDQILISLTRQAACGITAVASSDGGFVEPGPQITSFIFNHGKLSDAWRQLAALAGSATPYGWFVDENLELHFFDATTAASSGVTFTTAPSSGAAGSLTEGHIAWDTTNAYNYDGTSLSNRVLVAGGTQTVSGGSPTTSSPTDVWLATGVQTAWPLRFTVSGTPELHVGGVKVTVAKASAGTSVSGSWVVEQNSVGQWFLVAASAPAAGTQIQIWYTYLVPIVAQATDSQSIAAYPGPNGGIWERIVSDSSLKTMDMAMALAFQQRQEYAFIAERLAFTTTEEFAGWVRAGWTCVVDDEFAYDVQAHVWGLTDTFLVIANQVTFTSNAGYRTMQITCVRA